MSQKLLQQLDLRVKANSFLNERKIQKGGYTEGEKIMVKLNDEFSMKIEEFIIDGNSM